MPLIEESVSLAVRRIPPPEGGEAFWDHVAWTGQAELQESANALRDDAGAAEREIITSIVREGTASAMEP